MLGTPRHLDNHLLHFFSIEAQLTNLRVTTILTMMKGTSQFFSPVFSLPWTVTVLVSACCMLPWCSVVLLSHWPHVLAKGYECINCRRTRYIDLCEIFQCFLLHCTFKLHYLTIAIAFVVFLHSVWLLHSCFLRLSFVVGLFSMVSSFLPSCSRAYFGETHEWLSEMTFWLLS